MIRYSTLSCKRCAASQAPLLLAGSVSFLRAPLRYFTIILVFLNLNSMYPGLIFIKYVLFESVHAQGIIHPIPFFYEKLLISSCCWTRIFAPIDLGTGRYSAYNQRRKGIVFITQIHTNSKPTAVTCPQDIQVQ